MERMPTVNVKEARMCFVQAAKTSENFGQANAVKHFVELEFPLSIFCRLLKYEEEENVQKGRCWQKQGWKRTPVECFKGHL